MPCPVRPDLDQLSRNIAACRPGLLFRARRLVGPGDADDLTQSTIERALSHIDDFQPDTNLFGWLRRIMFNLSVDGWRRRKAQLPCLVDPDDLPTPAADEQPAWAGLTRADVRGAARTLSPPFRRVFELHHEWGLSYAEIGRQLRIPTGTVGTRLMRARHQVRAALSALVAARSAADRGDFQFPVAALG
jgi:RNA polymerase sigma-70 factor (ECF subfamily)